MQSAEKQSSIAEFTLAVSQVSMSPWLVLCAKPAAFDKGVPSAETAN